MKPFVRVIAWTLIVSLCILPGLLAGLAAAQPAPVQLKPAAQAVCRGTNACRSQALAGAGGIVRPAAAPSGYGPAQWRRAYSLPAGSGATVAVVDAYGDPSARADLDRYSQTYGLPVLPVCSRTTQASCFEQINQRGAATLPPTDAGWALETALDIETIHAVCPGCRLELVEADTASTANLMSAVDQAVGHGAVVVSLSWGGSESASELNLDAHFNRPGVVFVASSGDDGYGVSYPAASPHVLAVGGTRLELGAAVRETAWTGAGSGCSRYEPKPAWQHDPSCARRSVADLAADADPATGASVYSTLSSQGTGWFVVGGTSLAAPLVAGAVALSGDTHQATLFSHLYAAAGHASLRDVTAGRNGACRTYLCAAGPGYDGPTGLGTLFGLGAL
ncbi:MAG TPA: S53 family peptidase [Candidatus Saccharimonas sp.]|nr:S53 family peptidase [Candidatus Saccharimonas sp.]